MINILHPEIADNCVREQAVEFEKELGYHSKSGVG
jgi:hypothetical protein